MPVTVYTNPNCIQCDMTKKRLDQKGIAYNTIDLSQDEDSLAMVLDMGYRSAPVVIAGDESWSGFKPDLIDLLAS
jgi:glutaredoxin-like protein NrdH